MHLINNAISGRPARAVLLTLALTLAVPAQTYKVLYNFTNTANGMSPFSNLILHGTTLYGTTEVGGGSNCSLGAGQCGVIFSLNINTRQETVLHDFTGAPSDGFQTTYASLIRDSAGNFYGAAACGGNVAGSSTDICAGGGDGVLFKLDTSGNETILHNFDCQALVGCGPVGPLARDSAGNLYGATLAGGPNYTGGNTGGGSVYKLDPAGNLTVLHSFGAGTDGASPFAGVLLRGGILYGTTFTGGTANRGTVYKVKVSTGTETVLHNFSGGADGSTPGHGGLVADSGGNLYGTTEFGGSVSQLANGGGVVFKIDPTTSQETVLYTFAQSSVTPGPSDGCDPVGSLIMDTQGNIYGTTAGSVSTGVRAACGFSQGTVYKLDPSGNLTLLHAFASKGAPAPGLTRDSKGNLYGVAADGGSLHGGLIFEITP